MPSYDVVDSEGIKIVVLGNGFVGKSSMIVRTVRKQFSCLYNSTVSFNIYLVYIHAAINV